MMVDIPIHPCGVILLAFVSLGHTSISTRASLPLLITKGTHYEVGHDMGRTFQYQIQTYFANDTLLHKVLIPWSASPAGQQIYDGYLSVINSSYPQYVEEMQGIADGAHLPFSSIFLNVIRREVTADLGLSRLISDSCSDVISSQPTFHAFGHNEDGDSKCAGYAYMVTAEIYNDRPRGKLTKPREAFTAYVYPGALAGFAFGFNNHGLGFSVNALYPRAALHNKTGHYILNRAILSASTVSEVISILEDDGVGAAYGSSINVADFKSQSLYNIEVAQLNNQAKSLLDVKRITTRNQQTGTYYHVNMYRRLNMTEDASHIVSSQHRAARIEAMPGPYSRKDILEILGDRTDPDWPIYRQNEKLDGSSTLCTAFCDIQKWTMDVYMDNPATSAAPLHTFVVPKTF